MPRPIAAAFLAGLALLATGAAPVFADAAPVRQIRLSAEVYAAGVANRDPVLMIAAAKLRKSAGLRQVARQPDVPSGESGGALLDWQAMLAMAEGLATGDTALIGLIEDIRAEATKGVSDGPVYSIVQIGSGGRDVYSTLPFDGGQYAEIYVEGKGSSDLNLFVHDDRKRLICSDTDISDIAYCGWKPSATAAFSVTVENKGGSANQYTLITN